MTWLQEVFDVCPGLVGRISCRRRQWARVVQQTSVATQCSLFILIPNLLVAHQTLIIRQQLDSFTIQYLSVINAD